MSQLDSNSANPPQGVLVQKPKTNIYTVMLIIAFVAMCIGCLFLYLEGAGYSAPSSSAMRDAPTSVGQASVAPASLSLSLTAFV